VDPNFTEPRFCLVEQRKRAKWNRGVLGLIDEYRARVYPVLVGGGIPFFPQRERRADLELAETRTFSSRVVYLRYRVAR
jgi:dihydrofolate reductase